ncbi:hypothetical protein DL766_000204 [Monosporascus sp. MC13-8B]|uniref:TMEM205-like domain-containing protein n=1 Tax=Monosporascus cannonballus TaxID=155416 RepID=A0ABY0H1R4_9PEZI|nr:hypothetical protein DL762_006536 [Monosporascus cannonballus]RYO83756.1 hypothetical protein DL763_007719 [Monosporascus cannonballus]RYP39762.1 hypothetical protein DL766_000204 [Monosporascus sp. MC13-8B]
MSDRSLLFSPAPYHILSYGTLLGTQVFHTFINATTSLRVLERPQFALLQRNLFPWYFGIQTVMPVVLAVTYPGNRTLLGALEGGSAFADRGLVGALAAANRWTVLVPLATVCVTGLINWAYLLPETNKVTTRRSLRVFVIQSGWSVLGLLTARCSFAAPSVEKKDGKRSYDAPPHSEEMAALNKKFRQVHGASSLLNLVTIVSTVVYGFSLSAALV